MTPRRRLSPNEARSGLNPRLSNTRVGQGDGHFRRKGNLCYHECSRGKASGALVSRALSFHSPALSCDGSSRTRPFGRLHCCAREKGLTSINQTRRRRKERVKGETGSEEREAGSEGRKAEGAKTGFTRRREDAKAWKGESRARSKEQGARSRKRGAEDGGRRTEDGRPEDGRPKAQRLVSREASG